MDFDVLEKCCKLISKYYLKELTIQPDGTITIVKEMHAQPQMKAQRIRKSKKAVESFPIINSTSDLHLVAVNLMNKADRGHLNNFNRYQTGTVLPQQGKGEE